MYEITPTPTRRSKAPLILLGAVSLLLLSLCMVGTVGFIVFGASSATSTVSARERALQLPTVTPSPRRQAVVQPPPDGLDYESAVLRNIYEQVNSSVVNVIVLARHPDMPTGFQVPQPDDGDSLLPFGSGSGFVWDVDGHIVTNFHVVEGADVVQITFSDGTMSVADVIGRDEDSDLAVLKIEPNGYALVPVQLGNMDDVFVGMRVAAIGNPFGLRGTLTSGIVSAIGRSIPSRGNFSIPDSIQHDASINPGNSGGPLLNERGELIGVNAQIRSETGSNSGVGFAIPIAIVARVVPSLIDEGSYEHSYMGVGGETFSPICAKELKLDPSLRGVMVQQAIDGGPADRAGLRGSTRQIDTAYPGICPSIAGGDLITAVDGQPVTTFDDILIYLDRYTSPGDTISLTVLRDGQQNDIELTLAARP